MGAVPPESALLSKPTQLSDFDTVSKIRALRL